MKKTVKYVLIGIGALVAIGIIKAATGSDETVAATTESTPVETKEVINQDSIQKAHTWDAEALLAYYHENEVKADNGLKDAEFWVKGRVKSIAKDFTDKAYVTLGSEDDINSVQCYFKDDQALAEIKKGSIITVKGICKGSVMLSVMMKECTIAEDLK